MKRKMTEYFKSSEGGLFSKVEKADVGDVYQRLQAKGVSMMGWADPFLPERIHPDIIYEIIKEEVDKPISLHYTAPIGNNNLKIKLAKKLAEYNKINVNPERNILITPGSDSGLLFAIMPFINPGDEVLIPTPSYPNNFHDVEILHGKVVPIKLKLENKYQININDFKSKLTKKTKMVILTHPNNPTTTVFNRQSLQELANFIIENDLILVVDQAFEDYIFTSEFISPMSLPKMFERTISVFSVSKGIGLSGLRLGYIVACDEIMDSLYANAVYVLGATNTIVQNAVTRILDHLDFMIHFKQIFDKRRKMAYDIFNSIENVSMGLPESGFLCWVNVSKLGDSSKIVNYLTSRAKVSINDGKNYGPGGEGFVRIVLGVNSSDKIIQNNLERIKQALLEYREF